MKFVRQVVIWVCLVLFVSFSYANTNSYKQRWDCNLIGEKEVYLDKLKAIKFKYIDEQIYSLAYDHLKSFCDNILDWKDWEVLWAYSPYLVDHLIDISFRKLDWIEELSYVEVDGDWKNWHKFLKEKILNPLWNSPSELYNEFKVYWNLKNISQGKLSSKYYNICEDIEKIYLNYFPSVWNKLSIDFKKAMEICKYAVYNRIAQEANYVKYFMIYEWNQALATNLYNYLIVNFLATNFNWLLEKYSQMLWYFRVVVQKVIEGTKNCSK